MRILITGASGFIGRSFLRATTAADVAVGLCFSHPRTGLVPHDLLDVTATSTLLEEHRPQLVVHCAARPNVDWCEQHAAEAKALNLEATAALAAACANVGCALAFLSTDYVFDGACGPYREDDPTHPINTYGELKLAAEESIRRQLKRHVIVRTTNVYGYDRESRNFLMGILPRIARGETVRVAGDQWGSPTHVDDLCSGTLELAAAGAWGTFHLAGPDYVNRETWAVEASRTFGLDPTHVVGVSTESLSQPAPRPRRAGLRSKRAAASLRCSPRSLAQGLADMRRAWGGTPGIECW